VTVQMDQSVDFKLLFEEVRGLDISSIAIISDFPGFFKRFYLSVMGDPTPTCLIGFGNKVSFVHLDFILWSIVW
jgi:hypothetical protein